MQEGGFRVGLELRCGAGFLLSGKKFVWRKHPSTSFYMFTVDLFFDYILYTVIYIYMVYVCIKYACKITHTKHHIIGILVQKVGCALQSSVIFHP